MLVSSCSEPQSRERINIALLLCDDLFPEIVVEHGEHAKIFEDFMRRSLTFAQCTASDHFNHDLELTMDVYDAQKMEYPSEEQIDGYDAFMCTGSASSAYDQVEWVQTLILFIAHLAKNHPKVKIFGICFGHQIISLALGGTCVIMNEGRWEIGPTKLCLTDVGEEIFGVKDKLILQEIHHDHVPFIPKGFHLLASTDGCTNQGMVSFLGTEYQFSQTTPSRSSSNHAILPPSQSQVHVLTVQGHPEFTGPIATKIVDKLLGSGNTLDLERQNKMQGQDGEIIGRAFWKILTKML